MLKEAVFKVVERQRVNLVDDQLHRQAPVTLESLIINPKSTLFHVLVQPLMQES